MDTDDHKFNIPLKVKTVLTVIFKLQNVNILVYMMLTSESSHCCDIKTV